jgi:hypothetical protein
VSDGLRVKVLLQDTGTLKFVSRYCDWTADADKALDFGEVVRAVDYVFNHRLDDVRAVIKFQDSRYELQLPTVTSVG